MNTTDLKSQEAGSPVTKADGPSGSKLHPGPATSIHTDGGVIDNNLIEVAVVRLDPRNANSRQRVKNILEFYKEDFFFTRIGSDRLAAYEEDALSDEQQVGGSK